MSSYTPTSRRPIADVFRLTAHGATRLCLRFEISPDTISYLSVVAAVLAAICFWKSGSNRILLLVGPAFCYLRLWFNMLDGMVALASGKASWRGEILNDLPDRVSDVVIFAGVAHSGWTNPFFGYWSAIFSLLTAYVGILGQVVGVHREFSGIMSKPWRMVMVHAGAWITLACLWWNDESIRFRRLTVLDWACLIVIVGCGETMIIRLKRIMTALRSKSVTN